VGKTLSTPTRIDRTIDTEAYDLSLGQVDGSLEVTVPAVIHLVPNLGHIQGPVSDGTWWLAEEVHPDDLVPFV
jgi:hypothetical protein